MGALKRFFNLKKKCELCGTSIERIHHRICFYCHIDLPMGWSFRGSYDDAINKQIKEKQQCKAQ